LIRELRLLERRTHRSGKDTVDHPRGGHDDFANAVCGELLLSHVAVPSLWRQDALLIDGAPAPMPTRADAVFAVILADQRGDAAAVVYLSSVRWAPPGHARLVLLDFEVAPLSPQLLSSAVSMLTALAVTVCAGRTMLFSTSPLVAELARIGARAEAIDNLEVDQLLAVAAALHISSGRVKITAEALAKAEHHPLGILDATAGDEDDPLRAAALIGVALALDEGRSLKVRAA
jgi:hypothetical protein